MLDVHELPLDQCELQINPRNVELPATLELILSDDGAIHLGKQQIVPPSDDGQAKFEQIKQAFASGKYKLIISPNGEMILEL